MRPIPRIIKPNPGNPDPKIKYFLSLEYKNEHGKPRIVNIVPGYVYSFKFYDVEHQRIIHARDVRVKDILNVSHNPNDAIIEIQYDRYEPTTIPVCNLIEVDYNTFVNFRDRCGKDIVWRNVIMVLGITAEEINIIILKLKFFDDIASEAFKQITLKANRRYRFTYFDYKCGALKEITGTLKKILRTHDLVPAHHDSFVREADNIDTLEEYVHRCERIDQKPVKNKKFFDADEMHHDYKLIIHPDDCVETYELGFIMLSCIRNCEEILIGPDSEEELIDFDELLDSDNDISSNESANDESEENDDNGNQILDFDSLFPDD
jgi:hypothetical protein